MLLLIVHEAHKLSLEPRTALAQQPHFFQFHRFIRAWTWLCVGDD